MDRVCITLSEWEKYTPETEDLLKGLFLGSGRNIQKLARSLTESGIIEILETKDGLMLSTSSYVGKIQLGNIEIVVKPKIDLINLMALLRYAFRLRDLRAAVDYSYSSTFFEDLLINQLIYEVEELLSRGLHRTYIPIQGSLSSPRGKIDMQKIASQGGTIKDTLPCSYYVRLDDCFHNRVILAGLLLSATVTKDLLLKTRVRRLAAILQDRVSEVKLNKHVLDQWDNKTNRQTAAYEGSFTIIKMIFEGQGISFETGSETVRLPGFMFDMNRFFQALLSRFLKENLHGCNVVDEYGLKDMFRYNPAYNPRNRRAPRPRPDFVVVQNRKIVSVLDAKYRDLWENPLPEKMLYQLTVYALSRLGNGQSIILYPTVSPVAQDAQIDIANEIHWHRSAKVILRPVNLHTLGSLITKEGQESERAEFAKAIVFG